ncbi:hypothetical protein [Aquabacterium sp. J223]|uniref:hypothetical protein n=1 Tax=Aquabacterium sp. J223 TaxID=2898431 RepID=UPI0021AD9829|nr:hypothetical protein [Aquabacterium sp. J223]UUX96579.1 hypothetical protein LRS07_04565 [Aquabacterium sp. J223]
MFRLPLFLATAVLALAGGPALATTVYRCGPEGRIYQQTPCAGGVGVDAADARSVQQRQAAAETHQRLAATADALARERQQRERLQSRQLALAASAEAPGIPARLPFAQAPAVRPGPVLPWRAPGVGPRVIRPLDGVAPMSAPYRATLPGQAPAAGR